MESVAARLGLAGDDGSYSLTELRVVILRRDLRFRNGVEGRIYDDNAKNGILVVRTVELISDAGELLTIHDDLLRTLGIF